MDFDLCEHRIVQLIIRAGNLLREAKGLPEEKNITIIYNETAPLFGIIPKQHSSREADHLPTPEESARVAPQNPYVQTCPECGEKSYYMVAICSSCKASEGGKYKVQFDCFKCMHSEKSEEPMVVWLERLGIDFGTQTKASLGIKTLTDDGLK